MRRLVSRPTNGYGRTKVGKTVSQLGRLARGASEKPGPVGVDNGVRIRKGGR